MGDAGGRFCAVRTARTWAAASRPAIGAAAIFALYYNFVSALPAIAAEANLTLVDIEPSMAFNDWYLLAARWLQQQAARRH
jgi:hypothetical protein